MFMVILVVSNYKITKSESYSQRHSVEPAREVVVSNYKITKSESYSQLNARGGAKHFRCI